MYHTEPRFTKDLDIWIEPTESNSRKTYQALKAFGAPIDNLVPDDFSKPGVLFLFGIPPNRIDLLTRIKGLRFDRAWMNRVKVKINREMAPFLSLEDIIKAKRAAGRPQDLIDLKNLMSAKKQLKRS